MAINRSRRSNRRERRKSIYTRLLSLLPASRTNNSRSRSRSREGPSPSRRARPTTSITPSTSPTQKVTLRLRRKNHAAQRSILSQNVGDRQGKERNLLQSTPLNAVGQVRQPQEGRPWRYEILPTQRFLKLNQLDHQFN